MILVSSPTQYLLFSERICFLRVTLGGTLSFVLCMYTAIYYYFFMLVMSPRVGVSAIFFYSFFFFYMFFKTRNDCIGEILPLASN